MSQLSDTINAYVADKMTADGSINSRDAASEIWASLDDEARETVGMRGLAVLVKVAAQRSKSEITSKSRAQPDLPFEGLHAGYALDVEERIVKQTATLTRMDMQRAIHIREASMAADGKSLKALKFAYDSASPFWDTNPDWTFGQCCEAIIRNSRAA